MCSSVEPTPDNAGPNGEDADEKIREGEDSTN